MYRNNYASDNRLDIVILGPMGDTVVPNNSVQTIGRAAEQLLEEPAAKALLATTTSEVHIPDEWRDSEIVYGILNRLDIADLVIINLTPKAGVKGAPSPNVYYEMGLLHALGIPVIYIAEQGTDISFYGLTNRVTIVPEFELELVKNALRPSILAFLNTNDNTDFSDNRITQFYGRLPIVDISAAVGLATGYYYNFVSRLLAVGGIISLNKEKLSRLIVVRPKNVMNTYSDDKEYFEKILLDNGYKLELEKNLTIPDGDDKGGIWVYHIGGIAIDLPRTIYPLKISPRLLSLQERTDKNGGFRRQPGAASPTLRQSSERLLDRVENALLYHVHKDGERVRDKLLSLAAMEDVPALLRQFGVTPQNDDR